MIGTRPFTLLAATALLVGAAAAVAPTAVAAPARTPVGAGYVASPTKVRSASMVLRVPTIACAAKSTTSIEVGLFGTINDGGRRQHWNLAVVATCHKGAPRYGAETDSSIQTAVRPGDRVKLVKANADSYEIDDLTSGDGVGGEITSGPGAPKPVLLAPVLFGVQVSGGVSSAARVSVVKSSINQGDLSKTKPTRERQVRRGSTVAKAAGLRSPGAFSVTVERT